MRLYGKYGKCACCLNQIAPTDYILMANANSYHLDCFACKELNEVAKFTWEFCNDFVDLKIRYILWQNFYKFNQSIIIPQNFLSLHLNLTILCVECGERYNINKFLKSNLQILDSALATHFTWMGAKSTVQMTFCCWKSMFNDLPLNANKTLISIN